MSIQGREPYSAGEKLGPGRILLNVTQKRRLATAAINVGDEIGAKLREREGVCERAKQDSCYSNNARDYARDLMKNSDKRNVSTAQAPRVYTLVRANKRDAAGLIHLVVFALLLVMNHNFDGSFPHS